MLHSPVSARVEALNARFRHHAARPLLDAVLAEAVTGQTALVSSFGAESVVLLHMVAQIKPDIPVLFIDTEMLFSETLEYQESLANTLGLTNVIRIRPDAALLQKEDRFRVLNSTDPDKCCHLRKTLPLANALAPYDAWITGRKRHQASTRAALELFENEDEIRVKINPLAHWRREDLEDYIFNNNLPRHPLIDKGYPSIGCAPCTSPVAKGEDPRAGRWRNQKKVECGIHLSPKQTEIPMIETVKIDDATIEAQTAETDFGESKTSLDLGADTRFEASVILPETVAQAKRIRIDFPSCHDGRGLSIARTLRRLGFQGEIIAYGKLIPDMYKMARRVGFDAVEISKADFERQGEVDWRAQSNWQAHDYQNRLKKAV